MLRTVKRAPHRVRLEFGLDHETYRCLQAYSGREAPLEDEEVRAYYEHWIAQIHEALKMRFMGHKKLSLPAFMVPDAPGTKPLYFRGVSLNGKPLNDPFHGRPHSTNPKRTNR